MKRVRATLIALAGGLAATWMIHAVLPDYWVFLLTTGAVTAIALQSVGIVSGRCGMTALCQMSFAGVGAWTVAWLSVHRIPGTLLTWTLIGGLAAVPVGALVGALSLRLRSANLAIATLGVATLFDAIFVTVSFPGQLTLESVSRPALLRDDRAFFVFTVLVFVGLATLIDATSRTRVGLSWLMLRRSERATAALGESVISAKLSAFAMSAFVSGIAGGLLIGQLGGITPASFGLMASLTLFAAGTMVGAQQVRGAVTGGAIATALPELLRRIGAPQDIGPMVFAGGALFALRAETRHNERSIRDELPVSHRDAHTRSEDARSFDLPLFHTTTPRSSVLELVHIRAAIQSLVVLDDVSLRIEAGTITGLIGENGSGKSTLLDAVSGFIEYTGNCVLAGQPIDKWDAVRRARAGLRRTWQQPRISPDLSVEDFLYLSARRRVSIQEMAQCREWCACASLHIPIGRLSIGQQRRLDVAGAALSRPRVLLLDEPTVGQSWDDACRIHDIIKWSADRGTAVVLVEHNKGTVRQVCDSVIVLAAGRATVPRAAKTSRAEYQSSAMGSAEHKRPVLA